MNFDKKKFEKEEKVNTGFHQFCAQRENANAFE